MKKIIVLLLIMAMCFTLFACGNEQDVNQNNDDQQDTTVVTKETIEVTLDNWKDYFELRLVVKEEKNDFDELAKIFPTTYFIIKEEFEDKVVTMDVAVEYSCTEPYYQEFSYNIETGEMIDGKVIEGSLGGADVNTTLKLSLSEDFRWGDKYLDYGRAIIDGIEGNSFSLNGNIASVNRRMYTNVDIIRVQGTITLVK